MRAVTAIRRFITAQAMVYELHKKGWRFNSLRHQAAHSFGARMRMTALEENWHANRLASREFTNTWLHIDVPDELARIAWAPTRSPHIDVEFHWFRIR
ncbi:MAG: hypothetical protein ACR2PA_11335 [Hyphomicrobiaceae bacterium]